MLGKSFQSRGPKPHPDEFFSPGFRPRSKKIVFNPNSAAIFADIEPPGPAPTIIMSYVFMISPILSKFQFQKEIL
jgi:hypothetical protein